MTKRTKEPHIDITTKKYKEGKLVVELNRETCHVDWAYLIQNEPVNSGFFDIELYLDNTWLIYEETIGPTRIPSKLREPLYQMFHKIGLRNDD